MSKLNRRDFLVGCARTSALALVPGFLASCAHSGVPLSPAGASPGELSAGGSPSNTYFARHFAIDESILQKVMARALGRGGDFCDLYFEHSLDNSIRIEEGVVNSAFSQVSLGVGIRVVQGSHFGYAFTEDLTLESMLKAADTASAIAHGSPKSASTRIAIAQTANYYPIETLWDDVGIDQRIPWLNHAYARVSKADPRVIHTFAGLSDTSKRILIVTSDGRMVEDYQPMSMLYVNCVAEHNGRKERNGYAVGGRQGPEFFTTETLDRAADEAVRRTLLLFDAVSPPAGEYPLVMGAGPSGILLHEAIGHGIEADFNRKNISVFADKLGQSVADSQVTIVDSATHPNTRGAINVDDEGNPGRETILVEKGVMVSYLHDRISAAHYQVQPTGSGRRESFQHPPLPRMRNTYMLNGPHSPDEIIRSVKRGIYAEVFSNGQVKIGEGSFSFYVQSGALIEDGRITAPIKDVNIIGNGPEVLSRITMVGNDLKIDEGGWVCGKNGQGVPVSQGMPTTLVSAVTVGGTRG